MAHTWFRFYNESVDDPKVQRLSPPLFKFWINCLCLASKHGGTLPELDHVAFSLRMTERTAQESQESLIASGLLDVVGNSVSPHNWNGRQYNSDVSTERVKRFRQRSKTVSATVPDTDSEQIQKTDTDSDTESSRPEPSAPSLVVVVSLPTNKADLDVPISQESVAEFSTLYPAVDVEKELRAMRGWLLSNPKNRKTANGMMKFVNAWLSKQQDRSKPNGSERPNKFTIFAQGALDAAEEYARRHRDGD